jgi:hypothetical protein
LTNWRYLIHSNKRRAKAKEIDIEDIDKETNTAKNESREAKIPQLTNFNPAIGIRFDF